jgi:fatty acid desaturase
MGNTSEPQRTGTARLPWRVNLLLAITVLLTYLAFDFFAVSLVTTGWATLFTLVCLAFVCLTPTLWGLVHEGIHGRLAQHPLANRAASRALCVLLGFSFDAVQFGHLMHHSYNGHEYDRPERMKPFDPAWRGWLRHWGHLLGGHYLFTALVGFVAFAPVAWRERAVINAFPGQRADMAGMRRAALKWSADRDRIRRIRFDCVASALLLVVVIAHYAASWPLLLSGLYGRALAYSVLDNLPHYGLHGRGDEAARNLRLPAWASIFVLNHNLHRAHHQHPNLPWRALTAWVDAASSDGSYLLAAIRQFSGPIRVSQ